MTNTIHLDNLINSISDKKDKEKLDLAFQSFVKRNLYAHYYFNEFIENSDKSLLALETIDNSGNIRTKFEAPAVAYVANAHAMIDSFPYIIFLALRPLKYPKEDNGILKTVKIKPGDCGFNKNFHQSLTTTYPEHKRFIKLYNSLMNNKDFALLRKMSNNNKHKFLTRISNKKRVLRFEIIELESDKIFHVEVNKFLARVHNKVLPKIYTMYDELARIASLRVA